MIDVKYSLLLIIPSFIHAQSIKPEWSDPIIKTRNTPIAERIVKGQPDELIAVSLKLKPNALNQPDTFVVTRFNKDLQKVLEKDLLVTRDRYDFHSVYNFKGNVFLFNSHFRRKEKFTAFYYLHIDPATLTITDSGTIGQYMAISRGWQPGVKIKASPDTSHILFFTEALYRHQTDAAKFYISVRDQHMNRIWDRAFTLPYANKFIRIEGFDISNDGEVYVICKHYDKQVTWERVREHGKAVPSYTYKILIAGKDDDQPREHMVDVQNRFVHSMALQFDANENMHVLGLYMNKYYGNITGHFMAMLDKSSPQTVVQTLDTFPVHDLLELLRKDLCAYIHPKDPGLSDRFKVIGTNLRSDGSIDLLTEYNYSYEEHEGSIPDSNRTNSHHTEYVANDIVVINYKKDGPVLYTRIPKFQSESYSSTYLSFKWMNHGNQLSLFYIDSEDNVKKDLSKRPDGLWMPRSGLVVALINDRGELQRTIVYAHKEIDMFTALNVCTPVDTDVLGLCVIRGRLFSKTKFQLGRLKL